MKTFKPSAERENEALWGDKDGYEAAVKRNKLPPLK